MMTMKMIRRSRQTVAGGASLGLVRSFSAEAEAVAPVTRVGGDRNRNLYGRLSALGATGGSVTQTLNEYIREGRFPKKYELERCIKELRKYKKYHHALEVLTFCFSSDS